MQTDETMGAWRSTIARNAIFTALTRRPPDRASGSSSVARLLLKQPSADATATELDAEARRERVRWASEQIRSEFTAQTWDLFWQSSIEGVSIAKLARTSGRTTGAIYVARHRVLARLKEKIAEVSRHWEPDREQKS
ncbi:MAG: hypothetical protein MI861_08840 [Pirellulales bacterium]|nr:hypothetical protein [Pirellulales bacterium]